MMKNWVLGAAYAVALLLIVSALPSSSLPDADSTLYQAGNNSLNSIFSQQQQLSMHVGNRTKQGGIGSLRHYRNAKRDTLHWRGLHDLRLFRKRQTTTNPIVSSDLNLTFNAIKNGIPNQPVLNLTLSNANLSRPVVVAIQSSTLAFSQCQVLFTPQNASETFTYSIIDYVVPSMLDVNASFTTLVNFQNGSDCFTATFPVVFKQRRHPGGTCSFAEGSFVPMTEYNKISLKSIRSGLYTAFVTSTSSVQVTMEPCSSIETRLTMLNLTSNSVSTLFHANVSSKRDIFWTDGRGLAVYGKLMKCSATYYFDVKISYNAGSSVFTGGLCTAYSNSVPYGLDSTPFRGALTDWSQEFRGVSSVFISTPSATFVPLRNLSKSPCPQRTCASLIIPANAIPVIDSSTLAKSVTTATTTTTTTTTSITTTTTKSSTSTTTTTSIPTTSSTTTTTTTTKASTTTTTTTTTTTSTPTTSSTTTTNTKASTTTSTTTTSSITTTTASTLNKNFTTHQNIKIASLGQFRIRDSVTGNAWSFVNDELRLDQGMPLNFNMTFPTDIYSPQVGYGALKMANECLFARHRDFVMWLNRFVPNNFDYAWLFLPQANGEYLIYTADGGGHVVGYDKPSDRVLIVPTNDARVKTWSVVSVSPETAVHASAAQKGPFILFHSKLNKPWQYNATNIGEGIRLGNGTTSLKLTLSMPKSIYKSSSGEFAALSMASNTALFVRHRGLDMWLDPFGANNYDFAWALQRQSDGSFLIYNDYSGGHYVGYDQVTDRVKIVPQNDTRISSWTFKPAREFDSASSNNAAIAKLGVITLRHASMNQLLASSGDQITLMKGTPLKLKFTSPAGLYNRGANDHYVALQSNETGKFLRHAGFVLWAHDFAVDNYDFAWSFIPQLAGDYLIYNDYNGGFYLGYDVTLDRALIVQRNDPRLTPWLVN